jgi:hypothetical protein
MFFKFFILFYSCLHCWLTIPRQPFILLHFPRSREIEWKLVRTSCMAPSLHPKEQTLSLSIYCLPNCLSVLLAQLIYVIAVISTLWPNSNIFHHFMFYFFLNPLMVLSTFLWKCLGLSSCSDFPSVCDIPYCTCNIQLCHSTHSCHCQNIFILGYLTLCRWWEARSGMC